MAAPTFTSITPDVGHPGGGYLVRIDGADFQQHPDPPATGYVGGTYEDSMQVEFNGVLATEVKVYATGFLYCVVPAFEGEPDDLETGLAVDVTLRNLGPPEEEVTAASAYTYQRTNLARGDGILTRIVRRLLRVMRRQIIQNISLSTETVYDEDTGDGLDAVKLATLPGIALFGPELTESKERRYDYLEAQTTEDIGALEYVRHREPWVVDIGFQGVLVVRDSFVELTNLMQEVTLFFRRNHELVVDVDPTDPTAGQEQVELWLQDGPSREGSDNLAGTLGAAFSFTLMGVPLNEDDLATVEWGTILDDPADVELNLEQF